MKRFAHIIFDMAFFNANKFCFYRAFCIYLHFQEFLITASFLNDNIALVWLFKSSWMAKAASAHQLIMKPILLHYRVSGRSGIVLRYLMMQQGIVQLSLSGDSTPLNLLDRNNSCNTNWWKSLACSLVMVFTYHCTQSLISDLMVLR